MNFKTYTPKAEVKAAKKWFLVDAQDQTLGHLATKIAVILRGKNKTSFTPHMDMGDYVVVINADKIKVTGNKEDKKEYIHHTGYLGHLKRTSLSVVRKTYPTRILYQAVAGMIPRNRLRKFVLEKIKIYAGAEHPHAGQKLETISI